MELNATNQPAGDLSVLGRARRLFLSLPPYWRFQLPGLALVWSTGLIFCSAFYGGPTPAAIATATWSTLVEAITMELMRRYYHRLIARGLGDIALLAQIVIVSIVAGTITDVLASGFVAVAGLDVPGGLSLPRFVAGVFIMGLFYLAWSILYFAIKRTLAARQTKEMLREMQEMATRAELAMLRYQINPHFLFNSLTSLRQQILDDPDKARVMTGELAGYLRYTLHHSDQTETLLGEELEAIEKYIALEQIRFEKALDVAFEIEPAARHWPVPSFLLQPLVENAFKHGAPPRADAPLSLRIAAGVRNGALHLEAGNTGRWREPSADADERTGGVGLGNLRRRLQTLYPSRHTFRIGPEADWVVVRISITAAA